MRRFDPGPQLAITLVCTPEGGSECHDPAVQSPPSRDAQIRFAIDLADALVTRRPRPCQVSAHLRQCGQLQLIDRRGCLSDAVPDDDVADNASPQPEILHRPLSGYLVEICPVGKVFHFRRLSGLMVSCSYDFCVIWRVFLNQVSPVRETATRTQTSTGSIDASKIVRPGGPASTSRKITIARWTSG